MEMNSWKLHKFSNKFGQNESDVLGHVLLLSLFQFKELKKMNAELSSDCVINMYTNFICTRTTWNSPKSAKTYGRYFGIFNECICHV